MHPQTICAHVLYASNDSQLNLPHTRNYSLGASAIAMITTPRKMPISLQYVQKLHSYMVLQIMCTLFKCLIRFAVKFAYS